MTPVRPLGLMMSPSVLNTAGQAFDLAWPEIAGNYGPEATKTARDRFARIILANPLCEHATAEVLKRAGLASMAAAERVRGSSAPQMVHAAPSA
jgi:hypothetical protein